MSEFFVSTVLILADGSTEGTLLHKGDRESCERFSELIPVVACSRLTTPAEARIAVVPEDAFIPGAKVGDSWTGNGL